MLNFHPSNTVVALEDATTKNIAKLTGVNQMIDFEFIARKLPYEYLTEIT